MILVDPNVFVDVWSHDPVWADWSEQALARAAEAGPLGVNPITLLTRDPRRTGTYFPKLRLIATAELVRRTMPPVAVRETPPPALRAPGDLAERA